MIMHLSARLTLHEAQALADGLQIAPNNTLASNMKGSGNSPHR